MTVLKNLTYALVSTWSSVSSGYEHVPQLMQPWIVLDHIWGEPWSCYAELTPPSGLWVASATPQKKSRRSCWTLKIILAHFSDKTHINKKGSIWRWKKKSTKMKTWKPRWVVSTLSFHEWLHHPWKKLKLLTIMDWQESHNSKKRFLIAKLMRMI